MAADIAASGESTLIRPLKWHAAVSSCTFNVPDSLNVFLSHCLFDVPHDNCKCNQTKAEVLA